MVDDAFLGIVPPDFDEARHREVLAQRMPLEAVVGQDPAQVRMTGEQDAVEIVGLALVPVGGGEDRDQRRHGGAVVGHGLHPDPPIVARRQEMDHDIEPHLTLRVVDAAEVDEVDEQAGRVVAEVSQQPDVVGRTDLERQFVVGDDGLDAALAEPGDDRAAEFLMRRCHGVRHLDCLSPPVSKAAQRSIVPVRRIFRCSSRKPYRSASAVGGQPGT